MSDLRFNALLEAAGIEPAEVRLLRHQTVGVRGRTPYSLWRDDKPAFEQYQSTQNPEVRSNLAGRFWASFVAPPTGGTMFVGLYEAARIGVVPDGMIDPLTLAPPGHGKPLPYDLYDCRFSNMLEAYSGRLFIEWGLGTRSWIQRADRQNKLIIELARVFREEAFPGYGRLITDLSAVGTLPVSWIEALRAARGVYLLTCPQTREQYVGAATGEGGFISRWMTYVATGHGGNAALQSRNLTNYQISILEVAGSTATAEDVLEMEQIWKRKLQSREMGLNRN